MCHQDDEADVLGLSLVTDPILQRVVTYICSEDSPSCLAGAISLQTRTQLVHVNSRQITLVLSMERGEEIVPILQNPVPVCVGYEGGLVDVKCLIPDGKSPTFFCRVGDSMIKCNNAMQTVSAEIYLRVDTVVDYRHQFFVSFTRSISLRCGPKLSHSLCCLVVLSFKFRFFLKMGSRTFLLLGIFPFHYSEASTNVCSLFTYESEC